MQNDVPTMLDPAFYRIVVRSKLDPGWSTRLSGMSITSLITEQGDVEDWGKMSTGYKKNILDNLKEYLKILSEHVD